MTINTKKAPCILIGLMLYTQIVCFSQNYFITSSKDSTACKQINFFDTNAQGKMIDFEYVNNENETIRLKKNDIPEILGRCNYSESFIKTANDLQIMDAISECYEEYKILKKK